MHGTLTWPHGPLTDFMQGILGEAVLNRVFAKKPRVASRDVSCNQAAVGLHK